MILDCENDWLGDGECETCFSNSDDPLLKALIAQYGSSWNTNERYIGMYSIQSKEHKFGQNRPL